MLIVKEMSNKLLNVIMEDGVLPIVLLTVNVFNYSALEVDLNHLQLNPKCPKLKAQIVLFCIVNVIIQEIVSRFAIIKIS